MLRSLVIATSPYYINCVGKRAWLVSEHARRKRLPRNLPLYILPQYTSVHCNVDLLGPFRMATLMVLRLTQLSVLSVPLWYHLLLLEQDKAYSAVAVYLERVGGAFIKAGQWAATRPDIFPVALCTVLSVLHSSTPHHSHTDSTMIVQECPDLHGLQLGPVIGSGTVGQVHSGRWRGRPVAIKVLHPGIEEQLNVDLHLLNAMVTLLCSTIVPPWIELQQQSRQFDRMMREQLDLRHEARTLQRFANNFRFSRLPVRFPRVWFAGERVLVEDLFDDCVPMNDFIATAGNVDLKRRVARCGVKAFVKMMLWDNFVHADLHPGNMMVRVCDDGGDRFELLFMDTGLVTELGSRDHLNFMLLFKSLIVDGDGEQAGRLIATRIPQPYILDPQGFAHRIGLIAAPLLQNRFSLSNPTLHVAPLLLQVMQTVREHRVRLDPAFTNLVWSVVCVEGVGRQLAPDLEMQPMMLQAAVQFVVTEAYRAVGERL